MNQSYDHFRAATLADAAELYRWRNDVLTRESSIQPQPLDWETHISWLKSSLASPTREILIFLQDLKSVGTVRIDLVDNTYLLSWTIAPEARGAGLAKLMTQTLANNLNQAIAAEVLSHNVASQKVAEQCGLRVVSRKGSVLRYYRPPK